MARKVEPRSVRARCLARVGPRADGRGCRPAPRRRAGVASGSAPGRREQRTRDRSAARRWPKRPSRPRTAEPRPAARRPGLSETLGLRLDVIGTLPAPWTADPQEQRRRRRDLYTSVEAAIGRIGTRSACRGSVVGGDRRDCWRQRAPSRIAVCTTVSERQHDDPRGRRARCRRKGAAIAASRRRWDSEVFEDADARRDVRASAMYPTTSCSLGRAGDRLVIDAGAGPLAEGSAFD